MVLSLSHDSFLLVSYRSYQRMSSPIKVIYSQIEPEDASTGTVRASLKVMLD